MSTTPWVPFREPFRETLMRTGAIALIIGAALAFRWGGIAHMPVATLLAFWVSFGGHWVEVGFLNGMRPRLPAGRAVQVTVRMALWFAAGVVIAYGMGLTALALKGFAPERWPPWWFGGVGFIVVELVAHLALVLRQQPNFYDGKG